VNTKRGLGQVLTKEFGGTHQAWTVPRAVGGSPAWHARRHNAPATGTLHASMPIELATLISKDRAEAAIEDALMVLRKDFDGTGWRFSTIWASAASPGVRRLTASRDAVLLVAGDLAEMRAKISREDPEEAQPRSVPPRHDAARPSPKAGGLP
jgi:hypothetical protein